MKAQSYFGGTKPKDSATKVKQFGHRGSVKSKTGAIKPKVTVKQVNSNPTSTRFDRKTLVKQVGMTGKAKSC